MAESEQEIAARLGDSLRRARTARRWSQATLAERLDVSVDWIGMLERGERLPSFAVLIRAAELLGANVVDLLGAPADEPWIGEALALLRALPPETRSTALAMLRGVAGTALAVPKGSRVQRRR